MTRGKAKGVITREGADNITKRLQGEWFRQTLIKAIDPETGVLDPAKIIRATPRHKRLLRVFLF